MSDVSRLIAGFKGFRATYFEQRPELFEDLAREGQDPKTLVIACSDSRVDPAILFNTGPGELFVVRNVANLVPPYEPDQHYHGTSAALEFAVRDLAVEDIIVLGHSQCGGINALIAGARGNPVNREFINSWISIAGAEELAKSGCDHGERAVEQAAIKRSIENLATFPWVARRVEAGELALHGWWFDLEKGALWALGDDSQTFSLIDLSGPIDA